MKIWINNFGGVWEKEGYGLDIEWGVGEILWDVNICIYFKISLERMFKIEVFCFVLNWGFIIINIFDLY